MAQPQTFKNHTRVVPTYHLGVGIALMANFLWSLYQVWRGVTGATIMGLVLGVALLLMFSSVRSQILRVQDRLIRLEMRLRLREVLPADLAARAAHLPVKQLVALRFASNTELPELVEHVLAGKLVTSKAIKQEVKQWQADHLRA